MPPLRGVVHAAMVLDDAPIQELNEARMWKAMAPKIIGAWNLHRQTEDSPLDFFVLFSSFSAVIGAPKQGNYAAANTFLDALAHHRRARGLPGLAINWGGVGDVGFVARNEELGQKLDQFGLKSLPVAQLLKILGLLMQGERAQVGVGLLDWQRLGKMRLASVPRFHYLVAPTMSETAGADGSWLIDALMAVEPAKRQEFLLSHLRNHIAKVLGTSAAKIDVDKPLLNLGLDSLMAVEIGTRFESELGVTVPPVKFMEGLSASGLATYVVQQLTERDAPAAPALAAPALVSSSPSESSSETDPLALAAKVDQLSEGEVDSLLQQMLKDESKEQDQSSEPAESVQAAGTQG
jgi:acyl carrier protein